ncbi:MAG: ATP-binding protein, partial [Betaproteobacteria bacterium]|nr:ATP-binding protein [Betaproteobacteria bacterium]
MKNFIIKIVQSNKNTVGGGIWYEPYALYKDKHYFGPYVYIHDGEAIYEAEYANTVDYYAEDWYLRGKQSNGALVWSNVYHDPVPDVTMITATAPFYDAHRRLRGVATADMAFTDIRAIVSRIAVGETGKAFILGAGGEYISFFDESRGPNDTIQNDADPDLAAFGRHVLATGEGMASFERNYSMQHAYFQKIPETRWILVILIDSSEIAFSIARMVALLSIVPVAGLLFVTFGSLSVAYHLRTVAVKVYHFAESGAAGDFSKRIEVTERDEFGRMETHLNTMMENSSAMHANLLKTLDLAQSASRAKGSFLATMSHEMRTPLNAVIGMTNIAKASPLIEKKDYCLDKISEASRHLLGVISDILDMSKIEADKFELSYAHFDFEAMLHKASNVIAFRVNEKWQRYTVHIDQHIPRFLNGDEQRLMQVVTNLLSNAVKFTPEGGSIRLGAFADGEENGVHTIRIEVNDTGIGIPEEQQAHLFSSFNQADSSIARKFGGTGLGLAISKRIVEMMDGRIWIRSEPGTGSTFAFTFRAEQGEEEERRQAADWGGIASLRVLIVDDDADLCEYFQEILQTHGIFCDTAASGKEASEKIGDSPSYGMYFVDWKMPGMGGIELVRHIKERVGNEAAVVMISTSDWDMLKDDAQQAGVDAFLPKPLFPSDICDCIHKCLGVERLVPDAASLPDVSDCFEGYRVLLAE